MYSKRVYLKSINGGYMKYPIIEKERIKNKLTVTELAEKIGICRKTYYNWQKRGCMPQFAVIALAEIFGEPADYLLSRVMLPSPDCGYTDYEQL